MGFTIRCFDLVKLLNITGCLSVSMLNDMGIPASCEGDLPSLVMMMISRYLTGQPSFMANPNDFYKNKMILAHCTIPRNLTEKYVLKTHFESGIGVGI